MHMKQRITTKILCFVFAAFLLFSCENEMDKHYETPDWLKGSTWEVLESEGNYSIFLEGAELAGFKPILEGKSIVTVMAPDDDAFSAYLTSVGKSSISDFTESELKKLIGFHILYYSYTQEQLTNFRPAGGDGETDEEKMIEAGLYYKFRTRSYEAPTTATDEDGSEITIYHNEAMIPVFSYLMFDTKGIDATYNYEYFYPNSTWTGQNSFNVSNASVTDYAILADNGYLYKVDRVLNPLNTIYDELKSRDDYSIYLNLYDSYSYYEYDEQLTTDFGNGTDLYRHYHESPLADIACEWPISDYRAIYYNAYIAYSVFAPSNTAFETFLNDYWVPGGYSSLDEVNTLAMRYLLRNSYYSSSIVFPEEIKSGEVLNGYDMVIDFDVDAVPEANRVVCQNGVFYGLDELEPPGMFYSITGPAFKNSDLSYYLYMLDATSLLVAMSSDESDFTALIPSNEQMEAGGISLIEEELWSDEDGDLTTMSSSSMTEIVNLHTVTGGTGITSSGTEVLRTNIPYTYWFLKDGKITTSVLYNEYFENPAANVEFYNLTETMNGSEPWTNGRAYTYDSEEIFRPLKSTSSAQYRLAITQDASYPYYEFSRLLRESGIADAVSGTLSFAIQCMIFVPTNEALTTAYANGDVPGVDTNGDVTDAATLKAYLACYFLPVEDNGMSTYPYLGSGIEGSYSTLLKYNGERVPLVIYDDGSKLSVQLGTDLSTLGATGDKVDVVPDFDYFPFSYEDGGVQYINGVL